MSNLMGAREEYIEREYKKWEERYVIPFENEFIIKAMLNLQHQFHTLPEEHIKSKADVLYSIQKIMRDLRLKPVVNKERENILIVAKDKNNKDNIFKLLNEILDDKMLKSSDASITSELETKNYIIKTTVGELDLLRGKRANYILNLTGDTEIDEYFRVMNKL